MKFDINKWNEYKYPLPNKLLSKRLLLKCLIAFRKEILNHANPDYQLSFQLKVKTSKGDYRSISPCSLLRVSDFALLLGELLLILEVRMNEYNQIGLESLVLGHKISDTKKGITKIVRKNLSLKKERFPTISISGYSLPMTMDLEEWGEVQYLKNKQEAIVYKYKSQGVYYVKIEQNKIIVDLRFRNKSVLKFTDELLNSGNLTEFKRTIGNYTYIYCDGEVKYKSLTFRKNYIKPITPSPFMRKNFITMDLETRNVNNELVPYAVSIYDGKEPQFYYLSDYEDVDQMLTEAIKSLMLRKYNGYTVYLHNMSMFDGVFLLRIISQLCEKPKLKMRKFSLINITLYFGKYHINFRDSYLLLQSSLDKLGRGFKLGPKGMFPHDFVNEAGVPLDYEGEVPDYKYFNSKKVTRSDYDTYRIGYRYQPWNLRKSVELYCVGDSMLLYQIISKFAEDIFSLYSINVVKYPTLPSLGMAIFKTHYLKKETICNLDGDIYEYLKFAFKGGYVEVLRPNGKNIKAYDINSMYGFIQKNFKLPIRQPTYFDGDLLRYRPEIFNDPDKFIFLKVEVECPRGIKLPFLLHKVQRSGTGISISPTGKWIDVYTKAECLKALELGYKLKIMDGIIFDSGYIFNDFVSQNFERKRISEKGSAQYTISKLLLNSLFGRFALSPILFKHSIISEDELEDYLIKNQEVSEVLSLNNGQLLIKFLPERKQDYIPEWEMASSSIAISVAITGLARTYLYDFVNEYDAYYADTDSVHIDREMDPKFVGDKLGQFKLENSFKEAVYIAPKVYGGITEEGEEIVHVKGLKDPVSFGELKTLLSKDEKIKVSQEKWYKNISRGRIIINSELYNLMITDNKRELVFDEENRFIATKPCHIDETLDK